MAWFVLARVLFLAAVTYSAIVLRPFHSDWIPNAAFGVGLASLLVAFEIRLKNASVTNMLGAMIGGAVGLAAAKTISAALFWTNTSDQRIAFLHAFTLLLRVLAPEMPYAGSQIWSSFLGAKASMIGSPMTSFIVLFSRS